MPFDDWKATATVQQVTVAVCLDRRLYGRWKAAMDRLVEARNAGTVADGQGDEVAELTRKVEADQGAHTFTFETVPYSTWRELVENHEPTPEQLERSKWLDHNPETFPPAAVAASCADPVLTPEDGVWLREHLPRAEFDRLFDAVMQVSVDGGALPKSVADIARTLGTAQNLTTP